MKTNQEIIDEFGKEIVKYVYDDGINYFKQIISGTTKWDTGKEYTDIFSKLNNDDLAIMTKYISETLSTTLFSFLNFFEGNPNFKIIYEENKQQIDLTAISESLKAEPIIENGWIQKFSKFKTE